MRYAGKKKDSNLFGLMYTTYICTYDTYIFSLPETTSETTGIDQLDLMFPFYFSAVSFLI